MSIFDPVEELEAPAEPELPAPQAKRIDPIPERERRAARDRIAELRVTLEATKDAGS